MPQLDGNDEVSSSEDEGGAVVEKRGRRDMHASSTGGTRKTAKYCHESKKNADNVSHGMQLRSRIKVRK